MFDTNKEYQLREGGKPRFKYLATVLSEHYGGRAALFVVSEGAHYYSLGSVLYRYPDGRQSNSGSDDRTDIVPVVVKKSTFENVYKYQSAGAVWGDRTTADYHSSKNTKDCRVGVLERLFEDGKLVDVVLHKIEKE